MRQCLFRYVRRLDASVVLQCPVAGVACAAAGPASPPTRKWGFEQQNTNFGVKATRSAAWLGPEESSWDFQSSIPNKPDEYMTAGLPAIPGIQGVLADIARDNRCVLTDRNSASDDLDRQLSD